MNAVPKKNIPNFSLSNSNYIDHQTVYLLIFIYPDIKNVYINIVPIMQICMHITVNIWVIATFSKHVFYLYHNNEVIENFLTKKKRKKKKRIFWPQQQWRENLAGSHVTRNVANASVIAIKTNREKQLILKLTKLPNR